jgi:hypothetical protein
VAFNGYRVLAVEARTFFRQFNAVPALRTSNEAVMISPGDVGFAFDLFKALLIQMDPTTLPLTTELVLDALEEMVEQ